MYICYNTYTLQYVHISNHHVVQQTITMLCQIYLHFFKKGRQSHIQKNREPGRQEGIALWDWLETERDRA